jgi:hypothetical protein
MKYLGASPQTPRVGFAEFWVLNSLWNNGFSSYWGVKIATRQLVRLAEFYSLVRNSTVSFGSSGKRRVCILLWNALEYASLLSLEIVEHN